MTDYDLSGLSNRSFETVDPSIGTQGDWPERRGLWRRFQTGVAKRPFDGKFPYPSEDDQWDGYGVIQAKFLQRSSNPTRDGQWAVAQLKAELDKHLDPDNNRRKARLLHFCDERRVDPCKRERVERQS